MAENKQGTGIKFQVFGHHFANPIASMYGKFTYIYHKNQPNVEIYSIHGWYGNKKL